MKKHHLLYIIIMIISLSCGISKDLNYGKYGTNVMGREMLITIHSNKTFSLSFFGINYYGTWEKENGMIILQKNDVNDYSFLAMGYISKKEIIVKIVNSRIIRLFAWDDFSIPLYYIDSIQ